MQYYELQVGNITYKLRLTTMSIIALEKKIKKNPILIFMDDKNNNLPTIEEMYAVLEASLKKYHSDVNAYDVFDAWLEDGHIVGEFTNVIVDLFKISGLFKNEDEKN